MKDGRRTLAGETEGGLESRETSNGFGGVALAQAVCIAHTGSASVFVGFRERVVEGEETRGLTPG